MSALTETLLVQKSIDRDEALYAAEQGYNHYLWKLNDDDVFTWIPLNTLVIHPNRDSMFIH